jgi:hypothetical protein
MSRAPVIIALRLRDGHVPIFSGILLATACLLGRPAIARGAGLTIPRAERVASRLLVRLGYQPTSQQYFSLGTNQPPATNQQYSPLGTNQHRPPATGRTSGTRGAVWLLNHRRSSVCPFPAFSTRRNLSFFSFRQQQSQLMTGGKKRKRQREALRNLFFPE